MRCELKHPERLGEQREYLGWQRIDLIEYGGSSTRTPDRVWPTAAWCPAAGREGTRRGAWRGVGDSAPSAGGAA
jgi:hypothetical protein